MTQLVMGVTNHFLIPVAEQLIGFVKETASSIAGFGKSVVYSIALSRQTQANWMIAQHMVKEFPEHTVQSLKHELDRNTIDSLTKEFYGND